MKKTALLLLSLVFAVAPLSAQHARNGYSGFSFVTPAQIAFGTDNNFLVDRTPEDEKLLFLSLPASVLSGAPNIRPLKLDDKVLLLTAPTLAFLGDSYKREFAATYQPEFEIFMANSDQNAWNHRATVDFTQLLSRRWQVSVGDAYRSSKDPSRTLQNVLLLLPRTRYQENDFRAGVSFVQSERTTYSVRFDNAVSTFGQNDPLQRRILDTISNAVSASVGRMVRRNHRLRVTYSIFSTSPWNRSKTADERVDSEFVAFKEPAHSLNAEYRFSINPKTVFEVAGGGIRTDTGMNYLFGAYADRRVGEVWFGGGYSRTLSFFAAPRVALPNGLASNSFFEILSFRMRGQPTRNIGVNVAVSGSRGIYGTLLGQNKTLLGRARIDYRLNERTVMFLGTEAYKQNRNDFVASPLSRYRTMVGLEYSISTEAERRTSRLNRDAENVAITEQGRKRTKPQQED